MTSTPKATDYPPEPILTDSEERLVLFPIRYPEAYNFYKKAQASVWSAEEMNLSQDRNHWENHLSKEERSMFEHVLSFFATADSIVGENLVERFTCEVQVPEFRLFYGFQSMIENVHWEVYSLLIDSFIRDPEERRRLFHAFLEMPAVRRKAEWALHWIKSGRSFATRIVAFAAVEGIFFSGSFATIFWLKKRGLMPGLTFSNELISRDEALHTQFACYVYSTLKNRLNDEELRGVIIDASEVEQLFWQDALKSPILGMNADSMIEYIKFVTDRLLVDLGSNRFYCAMNPYDFVEMISLEGKTNFFEKRVSEYAKAYVGRSGDTEHIFTTEADF
ncbi:probable Putative ribonucleoside-diphosphate reductase small chain B [Armillaria ostoyae]|uniref:Probable Putative ribonucleoside-diphosphate reductase small chain B n=1 Tax=Armillaria ostoyae TaxID=47428 RepID=A0A284S5T6_ARMOS|nr:probable Putative ribonucleoside-diphosphate reductase small chain B [Armillaria ostoyae]